MIGGVDWAEAALFYFSPYIVDIGIGFSKISVLRACAGSLLVSRGVGDYKKKIVSTILNK